MEPCEELTDFDKGQVVVAREMGLSVSETAKMVGCSRAAVVRAYRQWYEEGLRLRAGRPRTIDPRELEDGSGSDSEKGEDAGGEVEEKARDGEEEKNGPEEGDSLGGQDAATSGTSAGGRDVDLETEAGTGLF